MNQPALHASATLRRRSRRRRRVASSATYHPNGSLTGLTYGNGLIHNRTLNARGLPYQIRDRNGGTSLLNYTYSYDAHGNLTGLTDTTLPGPWTESRSLAYDARDRMTLATAPGIFGEELYDYDVLDNVRRMAVYPNGSGGYVQDYRYQYSPINQRLTRIDEADGSPQWFFGHTALGETDQRLSTDLDTEWTYQWDSAQRMTRSERTAPQNRVAYPLMPIFELSFLTSRSLTPDGLRTDTSSALQTTWETYTYDTHGHRTRSNRSDGSNRIQVYSRSGQLLYVEDSRDNQRIDYIHLGGKLIAQRSRPLTTNAVTTTYHHTDHLGSANVETNAYGIQTQRTIRMPYGAPYTGLYREGPGYTGHVTDTHTNLTYMQQRYYDPVALRFLTPDPVDVNPTNGSNFNRYWYANNNPMRFVDPDGMAPCTDRADCARRLELADQARGRDGRIIVGGVAAAATAGATAAVATPSVLRAAALLLFKQQKASEQAGHTIPKDRAPHIFREKEGHLSDTPQNRETLQRVADDPKTTLGTDKYGNTWSAQQNKDGSQVWTQTRDGEIRNAGVNESPRQFNPETGLSRQVRPDKEIK